MKRGREMSYSRKYEIVKKVLTKSKGLTMLHGEHLVDHVTRSIVLHELPVKKDEGEGSN